jgi:hypothetical protein
LFGGGGLPLLSDTQPAIATGSTSAMTQDLLMIVILDSLFARQKLCVRQCGCSR